MGPAQQTLKGHASSVNVIAFSQDGKVLVSVSHEEMVRVWDAARYKKTTYVPRPRRQDLRRAQEGGVRNTVHLSTPTIETDLSARPCRRSDEMSL